MSVGAPSQTCLVHCIQAVHGVTRAAVMGLRARLLDPAWEAWTVRVQEPFVLLMVDGGRFSQQPEVTRVELAITDSRRGLLFAGSGVVECPPLPRTDDAEAGVRPVVVAFAPAPAVLVLQLVDEFNRPLTDRAVVARATSATDEITLHETKPGLYQSAAENWHAEFYPFEIHVDDARIAHRYMDYDTLTTRMRVVVSSSLVDKE